MTRVWDPRGGTGELESGGEAGLGEEMEPLVGSSGQARKKTKNWKVRVTVVGGGETGERSGAEREAALWEKAHFQSLLAIRTGCDDRYR